MLNILSIFASVIFVMLVLMGYIVLKKNRKNPTNVYFFAFSSFVACWLLSSYLENLVMPISLAEIFLRLDFFFGGISMFFAFAFLFNFPKPNPNFNRYLKFIIWPFLFISFLAFSPSMVYGVEMLNSTLFFEFGSLFWIYALVMMLGIISGLINQISQYRKNNGVGKMQIRYVFLGFLVIAITTLFNLFFQTKVSANVFRLINFSPIIMFACIFYATIRYHLLDIRLIVRLGGVFFVLLAVITSIYASLGYIISDFFHLGQPWNYLLPSVLIIFSFGYIKSFIENISNKIFFQKKYHFSEVIGKIEEIIRLSGLDLDKTLVGINELVLASLKVEYGAVLVSSPQGDFVPRQTCVSKKLCKTLARDNILVDYLKKHPNQIIDQEELAAGFVNDKQMGSSADAIIDDLKTRGIFLAAPIKFDNKLLGIYLLSNKLSRDYFSKEDFELIKNVAWHLGFAINNAKIYEKLKKIDEDKSRFISIISHQFRTPLTASRFNLELCSDPMLPKGEKEKAVKAAYQGVLTLSEQLDHLLLVLEIEDGKIFLNKEKIEACQLLARLAVDNCALIEAKKIHLHFNFPPANLDFFADQEKITKVLNIFLGNAIKYVFQGGKIDLGVREEVVRDKKRIVFSIFDDGISIEKDSANNMAKKFFRGQEAVLMSPDGFGLGLFIAKKIIEAHGGEIWFKNLKDRGAGFFFFLPQED